MTLTFEQWMEQEAQLTGMNPVIGGTAALGHVAEAAHGGQAGLMGSINNISSEWEIFNQNEAYMGQPDYGAAVDWNVPQPQYNYTPPAPVANPYAEIVAPTFTRTYDASGPMSQQAPSFDRDPMWNQQEEWDAVYGDPVAPGGGLNAAGRAIIGMDTPADLIGTDTPFTRSQPIDPFAAAVRGINAVSDFVDRTPITAAAPGLNILANRLGLDVPTTGEVVDEYRNRAIDAAGLSARYGLVGGGLLPENVARGAADLFLPRSTLEVGLELLPGIGTVPDLMRGMDTAQTSVRALNGLPNVPLTRNPLIEVPHYSDEMADLARRTDNIAGITPVSASMPTRNVSQLPFGTQMAGGADETIRGVDDYAMQHRPPGPGRGGAPLHDLTGGGEVYPDDIYSPQAVRYYGTGDAPLDRQTIAILQRLKDNPDATVTIYRAVPDDVAGEITAGDWVTVNRNYAQIHGEGPLQGKYRIISKEVTAKDVFTNGDSIHEAGYFPQSSSGTTPPNAVFNRMRPNSPSPVGPRPPMEEGPQPRLPSRGTADVAAAVPGGAGGSPSASPASPPSRYYHETSPQNALDMLFEGTIPDKGFVGKTGVYLSDTPDLAIGQGGKGGLVEFDAGLVDARPTVKPGQSPDMAAIGQEYVTTGAKDRAITSVTIRGDLDKATRARINAGKRMGDLVVTNNPDGSITVTRGSNAAVERRAARSATPPAPAATSAAPPAQSPRRPPVASAGDGPLQPGGGGATAVADKPAEGFAGNIRLSKYPEDIRGPIKEWADSNPEAVQTARRGIQSDEQVRAAAQELVEDVGGDFGRLQRSWKSGDAWSAEEIVAIRGALNDATDRVLTLSRLPDSTENQLKLAEAILEQQRIQQVVHGVTAEAGRALRAFRQQANAVSGDTAKMQELLRQAIGTNKDADIQKLTEAIKALDVNNPAAVNNFLRNVNKPNFWDKLYYYWINSILSGPITQTRNIFGNAATTLYSPIQRTAAATMEQPLAALQGRQAERFWQEAPASVIGMFQGFPEGVRGALTTMKTGISPRAASKLDMRPQPIGGLGGAIIGAPTRALGMADEFFFAINYRSTLNAEAVRMARSEGLRGTALKNRIASLISDPPPGLVNKASQGADEMVFRGDPGEMARAISYLRSKVPGGRYVVPFLNTPANLLKYGIKNSPLGLLDANAWRKAAAGNPEGADELANALVASMIAAGISSGVATGLLDITAAAPIDSAERDRFYREGKMPFSVKIPGVGWVEYKQLPMLDTTLTLVASAVDGIRRGEDVGGIVTQAVTNIGTNLLDKSYMSGISDLFDAIDDPARYAERYITRQLTGYVPFSGLSRQSTQMIDRTVRQPEGLLENLKAQTPRLSEQVPGRLDAFGREIERDFPSPLRVSPESQTEIDAELERLGIEVGFVGDSIGGRKLSRDEKYDYQQIAGQSTLYALNRIIPTESYQRLSDEEKQTVLDRILSNARTETRKLLGSEQWGELTREQQKQVIEALLRRINQ